MPPRRVQKRQSIFAKAVHARMAESGLTVNALYERLKGQGVTRSNLYYFLDGQRNMPINHLEAIFQALRLKVCKEENGVR